MAMSKSSNSEMISIDFQCVNCDKVFLVSNKSQLYCLPHCQQFAAAVRYIRARIKDETYSNPDIQDAIIFKLKSIYGKTGHYDQKTRRIPLELRNKVIQRDKGICCKCKKTGSEIDHINGDSADMGNLQLLCHSCHKEKTKLNIAKLFPEDERYSEVEKIRDKLWFRVDATSPERACDDSEHWDEIRKQIESEQRLELKKIKKDVEGTIKEKDTFERDLAIPEINDLSELESQINSLELQKQAQIDQIITPEMQSKLNMIELDFAASVRKIKENIENSKQRIRESVLRYGTTIKGTNLQVVFIRGSVTWDSNSLEKYAELHPEILEYRKEGKPSVRFRRIDNKKKQD